VPIIIASYAVGAFLLGRPLSIPADGIELLKNPRLLSSDYYSQIFVQSWYVVEPFALGATVLSVVCSVLAYPLTLRLLRRHRKRRQEVGQ
jgi:uncharacterized protein (DUF2062 family)